MKKFAALALLGGLGLAVQAEDTNWVGISAGLTLGASRHTSSWTGTTLDKDRPSGDASKTGLLPGIQVGYDWRKGKTVLGVELSHEFGTSSKEATVGSSSAYPIRRTDQLKSLSSLTFRWGLPQGANLYYVRGGVGFIRAEHTFLPTMSSEDSFTATNKKGGLLLGVGFERRVADDLAFRAEYMHFQGGSESYTWAGNGQTYAAKERLDTLKVGLNWRF